MSPIITFSTLYPDGYVQKISYLKSEKGIYRKEGDKDPYLVTDLFDDVEIKSISDGKVVNRIDKKAKILEIKIFRKENLILKVYVDLPR